MRSPRAVSVLISSVLALVVALPLGAALGAPLLAQDGAQDGAPPIAADDARGPPQVGDMAPPVTAKEWLNGAAPDLAGKAVMVEFWGTWCGPCVAAMPHVQDMWTRYREQGLVVAAISYEAPDVMQPFLDKKGYTMPVGSDPEKSCVMAFGVDGWPTTFVIGRDGRVIYRGSPMSVEPFLQQALGIDTSPPALLARATGGGDGVVTALEQLARSGPRAFDLANWARGQGGVPAERAPKDAGGALSALLADAGSGAGAEASADAPRRAGHLAGLAAGEAPFDLRAWAARALPERFPATEEELVKLAAEERYGDVVQAIILRHPPKKALSALKSEDGLRDYCNERVEQVRVNGRLLVLLGHWVFGEYQQPNEIHFPPATGVMSQGVEDGRGMSGVALNTGEIYVTEDFPDCIESYLAQLVVVEALAKRKTPDDVAKGAAKLHAELLEQLEGEYGTKARPKPKAAKAKAAEKAKQPK